MIQGTSRAAWDSIQPKLGANQETILTIIRSNPNGITNAEIAALLNWTINRVTPRVNELVKKKVVLDAGKRTCKATGNTAHAWRSAAPILPPAFKPVEATTQPLFTI
jgi:hypothetical protein